MNIWKRYSMRVSKNWVKFNKMFTLSPWDDVIQLTQGVSSKLISLQVMGFQVRLGHLVPDMIATIIEAPSSTKNKEQQRDPQMHQTKKGNQWHFGMKAHIGVDAKSGLTHSLVTTAANEHDLNQLGNLLHGEEQFVSADAGYQGAPQREELAEVDVDWLIAERPGKVRTLKQHPRKNKTAINIEYMKASIRAKVEHPFRIIKRQFGFVKARYKGLLKNDNQLAMLFTLANLFRADQMIRQWERSH